MVPAGADADLPNEGLAPPGEVRDQPRLQHVLLVAVAGVLVLAERVDGALPREHAGVDGPGVDLLHLAVEPFDPDLDFRF